MPGRAEVIERKILLWILQQERKRLEQGRSTGVARNARGSRGRAPEVDQRRMTR